ncbi:MAG: glutamine synthetase [Clostridia bacterium]|nr:glutamine synthetase [Clostridia bacterium]
MKFTVQDVKDYIEQEDVMFIRLAFCDVFGKQKNVSIMASELDRAFESGIAIDASAVEGFGSEEKSDLFLFPDPSTLSVLPWRPSQGRVVRMYCDIKYPGGESFEMDGRHILSRAVAKAAEKGISVSFGAEHEFYLFKTDEDGRSTGVPHDEASYMDIAPEDRGVNVRREICLTLSEMGILPESSHHEEGPGQHEIDFKYSDALEAADNSITFKSVVSAIAEQHGLWADFSPKPLPRCSGNGLHINMAPHSADGKDYLEPFMAGVLKHIAEITAFLNPTEASYKRLGTFKAPKYITWSRENRSQLIRIPAASGEYKRMELRSPDSEANPYIAYSLLIYAGLDGIENNLTPPVSTDLNLFETNEDELDGIETLPQSFGRAIKAAEQSEFVRAILPARVIETYARRG